MINTSYYPNLEKDAIYHNKGGGDYKCLYAFGRNARFQNVKSGWTLLAHNVIQYIDTGYIEWDYSTGGSFEPIV